MAELDTNFVDAVLSANMNGKKRVRLTQIAENEYIVEDITEYEKVGSEYGQKEINTLNETVNGKVNKVEVIDDLDTVKAVTEDNVPVGCKAVTKFANDVNQRLQEQIEMCSKENLIPFPYCATATGSYAKSFNHSSLTTVEAKNDGSLLIGSNGKIPLKTNQVLFRLIHDDFENIPLDNNIYSIDPHFENRPSTSGVALSVSFEQAKDSELKTFYVTSPVEINNIDGKYTKIKYISVWLSTATASFENVKMKPTITRGGITEKRDVVSQKLSMDAIVARTRNSLNIVHLPLKETETLTLAQLYNSYAKQNDALYVTVIDYSDSKSYKSSTMLLFIDDFQIYAISTEGLLKYDNVNDKWAVIIPRV